MSLKFYVIRHFLYENIYLVVAFSIMIIHVPCYVSKIDLLGIRKVKCLLWAIVNSIYRKIYFYFYAIVSHKVSFK